MNQGEGSSTGLGGQGGSAGGVDAGDATRETKRAVRTARRALRREIAATRDLVHDGDALAGSVTALVRELGLAPGSAVLAYESLPHEPPTAALVAALQQAGHTVLYPITRPDLDLDWHRADDRERTPLGLDTPAAAALALVPGLSVDALGTRLGQGGGCYDRVLPRLVPGTPVVVLLHPGEVSADPLPREPHDQPVPAYLTAETPTPRTLPARG